MIQPGIEQHYPPVWSNGDTVRDWRYVMGWQFWRKDPGPATVDEALRDAIMSHFKLTVAEIDKLSVLRRAGTFVGRPVTRLRVYDPSLLNGEPEAVKTFLHLDTQAQAICFEGHSEKDRPISLNPKACLEKHTTAA